jgi:putative toxin-antitoxin system antitoxin component (TIGR02293 family)
MMPSVSRIAELLGGRQVLKRAVTTVADLEAMMKTGIPFRSLKSLVPRVARSDAERSLVEDLVAPRTTRLRREQSGLLSPEESQRAERIARLQTLAEYVLESADEAHDFLFTPHQLLEGEAPMTLARTDVGTRRVEDILWKLEHGLPV